MNALHDIAAHTVNEGIESAVISGLQSNKTTKPLGDVMKAVDLVQNVEGLAAATSLFMGAPGLSSAVPLAKAAISMKV